MGEREGTAERIRELSAQGRFSVSQHASQELRKDGLTIADAVEAIVNGEIAEDYRDRECCIVSGIVRAGSALHVVVDYRRRDRIIIVTAYIPEGDEWIMPRALERR